MSSHDNRNLAQCKHYGAVVIAIDISPQGGILMIKTAGG
jgi:hypothetical protein